MTGDLGALFSADVVAAIERLVDERVQVALADRDTPIKRWLTAAEAGDYLGCSDRAVYERIRKGRIPADAVKRSGRSVLVDRKALDQALERLL